LAVVGLDHESLVYNRMYPNGNGRLVERVAKSLPSKPRICIVNMFDFQS